MSRHVLFVAIAVVGNVAFISAVSLCCGTVVDTVVSYIAINGIYPVCVLICYLFPNSILPGYSVKSVSSTHLRHGLKWGLITSFTYSILQLLTGLSNVSYATSTTAMIAIILLDYIVDFTVLGLLGVVKKNKHQTGCLLYTSRCV